MSSHSIVSRQNAKITSKGQITLPASLRADLKLRVGDSVTFVRAMDGSYSIETEAATFLDLKGVIKIGASIRKDDIRAWIDEARGRFPQAAARGEAS